MGAGALIAAAMFVTPPAVAGAGTASTAPAFTALGRCLEQNHRLLLAFVMDESGSLGDASRNQPGTDPTAQRVTAAQVAVQGLADLAGRGVQVKVLLSGFSDDLHTYGPWQTLDQTSTGAIAGQLASFRTRDQGLDTDFYDAIAGVQRALSAEAATTHNAACQVVLLFTDGRFDIATTGSKAYDTNGADPDATKVAKGIAALCAPSGPMQKLRRANGETITLALADPSAPNADQPDRAFLSRLASGDCGSPGAQYGASFDAANSSDLVDQFDAAVSNIRGGTQQLGGCVGNAHAFDIVPALGSFHVLADVGSSPQDVVVTAPNHQQLRVSPSGALSRTPTGLGVRASVTSHRFVSIDAGPARGADPASSTWSGRWTVNFAGANPGGTCQVFFFNTWKPVLRGVSLRPGQSGQLVATLVDSRGRPAAIGDLRVAHSLTATITAGSAKPARVVFTQRADQFVASYAVPRSLAGQSVTLTSVFHVAVGGADVASSPASVKLAVGAVAAPGAHPRPARVAPVVKPAPPGRPSKSDPVRLALMGLLVFLLAALLALFLGKRVRRPSRRRPEFVQTHLLQAARVPVRVRRNGAPTRVAANGTEAAFALRESDFLACPLPRVGVQRFVWKDLKFEAVARRRLFKDGYGKVSLTDRFVTASGGTLSADEYTNGRVALDLRGTWVYELESGDADDSESFVDGYVTVFIAAGKPVGPQAQRLVESFNSFLTEIVLRLANHAPAHKSLA